MSLTCGKGSMSLPFAQLLEPAGACTSTPIPLGSAQWNKSGRTNQNEQHVQRLPDSARLAASRCSALRVGRSVPGTTGG